MKPTYFVMDKSPDWNNDREVMNYLCTSHIRESHERAAQELNAAKTVVATHHSFVKEQHHGT